MGSGLFHMTIAMMRLNSIEGAEEATAIINELQVDLQELLERNKGKNKGKKIVLNKMEKFSFHEI